MLAAVCWRQMKSKIDNNRHFSRTYKDGRPKLTNVTLIVHFAPNKSQKSPSIGKKCPEGRKVIKPNEVEGTHRIASVSVFSGLVCKVSTSSSTIYMCIL